MSNFGFSSSGGTALLLYLGKLDRSKDEFGDGLMLTATARCELIMWEPMLIAIIRPRMKNISIVE